MGLLHLAWRLASSNRTEEGIRRVWKIWIAKYQWFSTCMFSRFRKYRSVLPRAGATATCLSERRLRLARHLPTCPQFPLDDTSSSTARDFSCASLDNDADPAFQRYILELLSTQCKPTGGLMTRASLTTDTESLSIMHMSFLILVSSVHRTSLAQ